MNASFLSILMGCIGNSAHSMLPISPTMASEPEVTDRRNGQLDAQMRAAKSIVNAINEGTFDLVTQTVLESHDMDVIPSAATSQIAGRILWLRDCYGPLSIKSSERLEKGRLMVWARGVHSKAWVGMLFMFSDVHPSKVIGIGLDRGTQPPTSKALARATSLSEWKTMIQEATREMSRNKAFSGSFSICIGGKLFFQSSSGEADRGFHVPNRQETPFPIASVTKLLTGEAIRLLVSDGKVQLDSKISQFFPEFKPETIADITVSHLLTHTSGIELDDIPAFNLLTPNSLTEAAKDIGKFLADTSFRPPAELGKVYDYSNENYVLLGRIIEIASKSNFYDFIDRNILSKVSMKTTYWSNALPAFVSEAKSYSKRRVDGTFLPQTRNVRRSNFGMSSPAGGLVSNTIDMQRFAASFSRRAQNQGIEVQKIGAFFQSEDQFTQFGMQYRLVNGAWAMGHSGALVGSSSELWVFPKSNISFVILSNHDSHAPNILGFLFETMPLAMFESESRD